MKDFIKFVIGTTLGLIVAALVAFNGLLLWVATGPRSLDRLSLYIARSFDPADGSYHVAIGHTWLIWDGWKHPIDIRLRDVAVLTREGQTFSTFPEISVGVDPLSLLRMRILPTSLTINHPAIRLFQNAGRSISFGFEKEEAPASAPESSLETTVPFVAVLAALLSPDSNLSKLRAITILDADAGIGNPQKGVFFKASHVNLIFRRNRAGLVQAEANAAIVYADYQSSLSAQFAFDAESPIEGRIAFTPLLPGTLAALFSDNPLVNAVHFPIGGNIRLSLTRDGALDRLAFAIDGGKGDIETDKLEGPLPVDTLHAEGQVGNHGNDIQFDTLTARLGGIGLAADGIISLTDGDMAARGHVTIKNAEAKDVRLLWPPGLSPESRQWVTENILEGKVPEASATINIASGDRAKPVLPKEDIDASIRLEGAKIHYLPEHPAVTHVRGVVHVDAASLDATIDSADYLRETKLSNGKLLLDDLNADNPYIKLSFDAVSPARDIVHLLGLPRLKLAAKLGLHEESAAGSAKGTAALSFHFFAPKEASDDDFTYDISAELQNVAAPGLLQKFDIGGADGKLTVNNSGLEFKGAGNVNGASASSADVRYRFTPEKGLDTFIDVTASAPVESLPRFGYPAFPFVKGTLGVKASVRQGAAQESSEAAIDLTNTAVDLAVLRWNKPDKEPASLELKAEKKEGVVTIPSFRIKGKDMEAHGAVALDKEFAISRVEMDKLTHGNNDLDHLLYEKTEGYRIEANGRSADASPWMESDGTESTFSFEHFPPLSLKLDVQRLVTGKGHELAVAKGEAECDAAHCNDANISGRTVDGKPYAFRILKNPKGIRQLSLHAENAGAFLKGIGIIDSLEGGDLTITGNYSDDGNGSRLGGRADIKDYTIKNAPVLARILSLASLTGFFDTLQGKGIHFDRLTAPFTLAGDVITVEKGKMHGDAIGMTADGTITFPKQFMDIQGTVVPSYTLNSVLGNVPLVGHILTGGEGQGIFAARYGVKGSVENPDVTVNPLAILTPGFLRGVFDIFDLPEKKE
ncbi:MAG: AsmA-like C-terminal domain-containing protein [Pseudomonadota bacterium]|nr:AsmA-like C-terminal domain-containing protein [Pseudomonadota bacterium]